MPVTVPAVPVPSCVAVTSVRVAVPAFRMAVIRYHWPAAHGSCSVPSVVVPATFFTTSRAPAPLDSKTS